MKGGSCPCSSFQEALTVACAAVALPNEVAWHHQTCEESPGTTMIARYVSAATTGEAAAKRRRACRVRCGAHFALSR